MNYQDPKLKKALVNDYIIGSMGPSARKRFERMLMTDPKLRALLNQSEQKWNRLAERIPPMLVPAEIWKRIEARLFTGNSDTRITTIQPSPRPSNDRFWKRWAVAASFTALFLTAYLGLQTIKPVVQDNYMAVVLNGKNQPSWHVAVNIQTHTLEVSALKDQPLPANKSYELWLIADNEPKPVSMGLIPASGQTVLPLDKTLAKRLHKVKAKLAVTQEPLGGSPSGQPTSAPIYLGEMIEFRS